MIKAGKGRTPLSQEQKDWQDQFNRHFGAKALLIISVEMFLWVMIGMVLSIVFSSFSLFIAFLLISVLSIFVIKHWSPAWKAYRKLLGDEKMPQGPMPCNGIRIHFQKQLASFYIVWVFRLLITASAIYLLLKYLLVHGI